MKKEIEESLEMLSPAEVAKLLGCDVKSLRRWGRDGRFPKPIRIGEGRKCLARYPVYIVKRWMEEKLAETNKQKKED